MRKLWRDRVPSLRSWTLRNFKSVVKADLALAPLTLVVGANSAGKSSLLQSILLMTQASDGGTTPGGFPLNGPLVGLGKFTEARTDIDPRPEDAISIGGSLVLPESMRRRYFLYARGEPELQEAFTESTEGEKPVETLGWVVSLRQDPESSGAVVENSRVTYQRGPANLGEIAAFPRKANDPAPDMLPRYREQFSDGYKMTENLRERTGEESSRLLSSLRVSGGSLNREYGAVAFRSGVPVSGLRAEDEAAWLLERIRQDVQEFAELTDEEDEPADAENAFDILNMEAGKAADQLYSLLEEQLPRVLKARQKEIDAQFEIDREAATIFDMMMSRADYPDRIQPVLSQRLTADLGQSRSLLVPVRLYPQPGMRVIATEVPEYFASSVLYLGPLRDDPRVTYPHLIQGSTHMPLGRKGESTASVLLQSQASGRRSGPGRFTRYPTPQRRTNSDSLEDAVTRWVKEFGLGKEMDVHDEARYGVSFMIDQRDLTSVGTGISQILPVIVLCLMARPGQLVLLEQPEIHLNPALQQQLADFFLAMVRSGRQLIVETHSEYLVTRMRRRVVEDTRDEIRNLFNIVFAERNKKGTTRFRVLDVDESGAYVDESGVLSAEDWPEGFFDQAGNDVEAMMRLALQRRQRGAEI